MADQAFVTPMTKEELHSQRELQARINRRLDAEKREREMHPGKYEEPLYDCSMGMSKILESISVSALIKGDKRQTFDVFIINALTIVRNCYDPKKSNAQILKDIRKDTNLFMQYVQNYFDEQKENIEKPYVIVYLPEYKLKEEYIRPHTEQRAKVLQLAHEFFRKSCTNPFKEIQISGGTAYLMHVGMTTFPHKEIAHHIANIGDKNVFKTMQRRYLLISNYPIDFHLQNKLGNKLYILESYTGKIKTIGELGEKVFKDELPFNQYTHLLFGDSVLIKPLVYRKEKKTMLEIAKKNLWTKKPLALILSDIRRVNLVPVEKLTFLKF